MLCASTRLCSQCKCVTVMLVIHLHSYTVSVRDQVLPQDRSWPEKVS